MRAIHCRRFGRGPRIRRGSRWSGEQTRHQVSMQARCVYFVTFWTCKNDETAGIVKTHRLVLSIPSALMAPGVPDTPNQARVNIGPTALRNMLEHFPMNKGARADPQLIWSFSNENVSLRTCESSMDRGQFAPLPLLHA